MGGDEYMVTFYRGLASDLPAVGEEGCLYFVIDEGVILYGTGSGFKKLSISINDIATSGYLTKEQTEGLIQTAFNKIKQEFLVETANCDKNSKQRYMCENRFNYRIGALVLMGCDDKMKAEIL
jgi:hypothetical protein